MIVNNCVYLIVAQGDHFSGNVRECDSSPGKVGELTKSQRKVFYYLRQVNEVNDGDNAFVQCVSVCLLVCLYVRSCRSWELNANYCKTLDFGCP